MYRHRSVPLAGGAYFPVVDVMKRTAGVHGEVEVMVDSARELSGLHNDQAQGVEGLLFALIPRKNISFLATGHGHL